MLAIDSYTFDVFQYKITYKIEMTEPVWTLPYFEATVVDNCEDVMMSECLNVKV